MTRRLTLLTGALIPAVFWAILALCAARTPGYGHLVDLVSMLGAAGTDTRVLFAAGLVACSLLSLAFVSGLVRDCRGSGLATGPVLLILAYTVSIAGAGIFPMPHRLHGILGAPAMLVLLSPAAAVVWWRRDAPVGLLPMSALSFLLMALGWLVFAPSVLDGYMGLKQRVFHAGWSVWFVYLSLAFAFGSRRVRATDAASGEDTNERSDPSCASGP